MNIPEEYQPQLTFINILDSKNKKRSKLAKEAFKLHRLAQFVCTRAEMYLLDHNKQDNMPDTNTIYDIFELSHLTLCLFDSTKWQKTKPYKIEYTDKDKKRDLLTVLPIKYEDLERMVQSLSISKLEKQYKASLFEEHEHETLLTIFNNYDETYEKVLKALTRLKSYENPNK